MAIASSPRRRWSRVNGGSGGGAAGGRRSFSSLRGSAASSLKLSGRFFTSFGGSSRRSHRHRRHTAPPSSSSGRRDGRDNRSFASLTDDGSFGDGSDDWSLVFQQAPLPPLSPRKSLLQRAWNSKSMRKSRKTVQWFIKSVKECVTQSNDKPPKRTPDYCYDPRSCLLLQTNNTTDCTAMTDDSTYDPEQMVPLLDYAELTYGGSMHRELSRSFQHRDEDGSKSGNSSCTSGTYHPHHLSPTAVVPPPSPPRDATPVVNADPVVVAAVSARLSAAGKDGALDGEPREDDEESAVEDMEGLVIVY